MMAHNSRQRGAALLIVLMIVALVSIMATEMGGRLQMQVQRATTIKDNNQAYWYAMSAEAFAKKSIHTLLEKEDDVVNLGQDWNKEFTFPLEGGGIQAELVDMQSCFNLNALYQETTTAGTANTDAQLAFQSLLTKANINVPEFSAEVLRDALADWLDSDSDIRAYGAEDSDYESLPHPYLAANALMADKSELRLVYGVDMQWFEKLLPLVCAIPGDSELKINVNTLKEEQAPILAALTGISTESATNLIASRGDDGYSKIANFFAEPEISAVNLSEEKKAWFDVTSRHFILYSKTQYNNAVFSMASLLAINDNMEVTVIRREFGGRK